MENPDDKNAGTNEGGDTKQTKAKAAKPVTPAGVETKPEKVKAGRACKETVRYGRKTYGVGDRLPADVPAEIIDRLEELGFV